LGFSRSTDLVGLRQVYNRHVSISLEFFKVTLDQVFELVNGPVGAIHFLLKSLKYLLGFKFEKLNQDVVFVFKIQIDRPIGDTGLFGDLRNGRLVIALAGKYLDGGF
jgi:hypothetical protein